jgi:hypothetical protein
MKITRLLGVLCFLTAPLFAFGAEPASDFKGLIYGDDARALKAKFPEFFSSGEYVVFVAHANGQVTLFAINPGSDVEPSVSVANVPSRMYVELVPRTDADKAKLLPFQKGGRLDKAEPDVINALANCFIYAARGEFAQNHFFQMKKAMMFKYGEPANAEVVEKRTRLGVKVASEEITWKSARCMMKLIEMDGNTETGSFRFEFPDLRPSMAEIHQKNAGDL